MPTEDQLTAEEQAATKRLGQIAQEMPRSNTPMGEQMTGVSYKDIAENARRQLGTNESVRKRTDPKVDKYSPTTETSDWESPEAVAMYNDVGPGRSVSWVRIPGTYAGDRDEIEDLFYRVPDAKVVTRKSDGAEVKSWDTVAVSIPKKFDHMRTLDEVERYESWEQSIEQETIHGSVTKKHPEFEDRRRIAADAAQRRSRDMGIGVQGISETALVPYETALRLIPREERLATEERERRGGRHQMLSNEDQAQKIDDARRGSRSTFGGLTGAADKWERSKDKQTAERARK